MSKNLELWNKVAETDPFYTKEVGYGSFKFTSINAQYQLRLATEQFGAYGKGWGIRELTYEILPMPEGQQMALAKARFFAGESEFPISSSIMIVALDKNGKLKHDDEWAKKIETDITTKALSKLGFNADVFLGRYDDNRYVNDMKKKYADVPQKFISEEQLNKVMANLAKADKADIEKTISWAKGFQDSPTKEKLLTLCSARKKEL